MGLPFVSICAPWATTDDVTDDECSALADLDQWLLIASDVLYDLSGRQWPGICSDTFRPVCPCGGGRRRLLSTDRGGCCSTLSEVDLGVYPLAGIIQVRVDGVVLDEDQYSIADYRYVVRTPGASETGRQRWPCTQRLDLPDTAEDTWSVTVGYGRTPPPAGTQAAIALACEMATSAAGGDCSLPERVTSVTRQGVTAVVIDPMEFLTNGRTGIYAVDLFLRSVNPAGLARPPSVMIPGGRRSRRTAT